MISLLVGLIVIAVFIGWIIRPVTTVCFPDSQQYHDRMAVIGLHQVLMAYLDGRPLTEQSLKDALAWERSAESRGAVRLSDREGVARLQRSCRLVLADGASGERVVLGLHPRDDDRLAIEFVPPLSSGIRGMTLAGYPVKGSTR